MQLVSFILRCSRSTTIIALLAGVVGGLSNAALLALINAALGRTSTLVSSLLVGFIGLCAVLLVSRIISEYLLLRIAQHAVYDLRIKISRRILQAPLRKLEQIGAHTLTAVLTDDIPTIGAVVISFPVSCMQLTIVIGILIYLGWLSPVLLVVVLAFMALGILTYQLPMQRGQRALGLARDHRNRLFRHFRAVTDGTKELKLHRRRCDDFFAKELEPTASQVRDHNNAGFINYIVAASWGQLLFFILIGLLIFAFPAIKPISPQALTGYTITILYMMAPLQGVLNALPELGRASIALKKVEEIGLSLTASSTESYLLPSVREPKGAWTSIELSNATHVYFVEHEDSTFTLGPLDLSIRPGEQIFLIGGNGSGKTTLAKLLTGLYVPETGILKLDGRAITDENRESYRQLFSVVFSDFFLFTSFLGLDQPDLDGRARNYLAQLQLVNKVEIKNGVLSTVDLSQGQRKRLALLTAYLEDRPIYVFDEWAADQDPYFKEVFYLQLLPELKAKGKTIIVISHDDRYYDLADRIIKLDQGEIVYDKTGEDVEVSQAAQVQP
jgi:putative pyoverdin transport system ATP-binding/permease protein